MAKYQSKKIPKILFIDSNIYIGSIYNEKSDDLDILKKILDKLSSEEIILVIPEVVMAEVNSDIEISHKILTKSISDAFGKIDLHRKDNSQDKISFLSKEIKDIENSFFEKYLDYHKDIEKVINDLFKHKNSKIIKLTQELLVASLKRSALKMPPSIKIGKNGKSAYLRDIDCIAYESLRKFIVDKTKKWKNSPLIICTDDSDYYKDKENREIYDCLIKENSDYCLNLKIYSSISEMFEGEISVPKTKNVIEQVKEGAKGVVLMPSTVTPLRSRSASTPRRIMNHDIGVDSIHFSDAYKGLNFYTKTISESEELCPSCDGNIKDFVSGFVVKRERTGWGIVNRFNKFKCPFCEDEFYVG